MNASHGDTCMSELSTTLDVDNLTSTHCVIIVLEHDCNCEDQQLHHHTRTCPIEKSTGKNVCVKQEWMYLRLAGCRNRDGCEEGRTAE